MDIIILDLTGKRIEKMLINKHRGFSLLKQPYFMLLPPCLPLVNDILHRLPFLEDSKHSHRTYLGQILSHFQRVLNNEMPLVPGVQCIWAVKQEYKQDLDPSYVHLDPICPIRNRLNSKVSYRTGNILGI